MAFWGVEVKPGRTYSHLYDSARGRLRVCQATLGNGKATTRSVVQCNVGDKSPVLLCSLIPNVAETCHLGLEFEEDEEVIFSVLGQSSVHLSGYYLGSSNGTGGDETDSYGEDIGEEDSGSYGSYDSEDDEYESDFIDDSDDEMFRPPQRKSGVVIEEIVDDEKPANENANRRRLKKKHQVSDTDDDGDDGSERQLIVSSNGPTVLESEDEDGFPISFKSKKKNAFKNTEGNTKSDVHANDEDRKRKIDAISQDAEPTRESCQPWVSSLPSEICTKSNDISKKKKKVKDQKTLETGCKPSAEEGVGVGPNQDVGDEELEGSNIETNEENIAAGAEENVAENEGKTKKKKKKEKAKKEKASETHGEFATEKIEDNAANEVIKTDSMEQDHPLEPEKLRSDRDENSAKLKKRNKKKRVKDETMQDKDIAIAEIVDGGAVEENKKFTEDRGPDEKSDRASDVTQQEVKKKKKKKNKKHGKDSTTDQENLSEGEEKSGPLKVRTFANGLVIEELSMGKPDGKRASPGSKVSVNYIGKLQNGKIFDSNVGNKPFKFRLGIGHVIKGWDVGVKGMRTGDKRRLTIPPTMGYGDKNVGKIPANSWLVFVVELVDVQ